MPLKKKQKKKNTLLMVQPPCLVGDGEDGAHLGEISSWSHLTEEEHKQYFLEFVKSMMVTERETVLEGSIINAQRYLGVR